MYLSKTALTLFFIIGFISMTIGQFSNKDFIIETKGLSEEYASRFKDSTKVKELVSVFKRLKITEDIKPIKITVSFKNGEGWVFAEINYNHEKIFSPRSDYTSHNENWTVYGKGISIMLQDRIFLALSQYKKSVATEGWSMDKDLLNFKSAVILKKANGDLAYFYAYNYLDSRGFYPYSIYKNSNLKIGGKSYETEASNNKMLKDMKYFKIGKTNGLDGKKTGAYYFSKFFNIK